MVLSILLLVSAMCGVDACNLRV